MIPVSAVVEDMKAELPTKNGGHGMPFFYTWNYLSTNRGSIVIG